MRALRLFKTDVALLTALCDLAGVWPVMDGDAAPVRGGRRRRRRRRCGFLFRQAAQAGEWQGDEPDGYIVLGMGKYGAFELNYSSDIDLIVFYDLARIRLRAGAEVQHFFVRLTRDLVRLLHERTGDGYVFRTDLRLRPDPGRHAARALDRGRAQLLRELRPELGARGPHQGAARRRRCRRRPGRAGEISPPSSGASISTSRPSPTSTP